MTLLSQEPSKVTGKNGVCLRMAGNRNSMLEMSYRQSPATNDLATNNTFAANRDFIPRDSHLQQKFSSEFRMAGAVKTFTISDRSNNWHPPCCENSPLWAELKISNRQRPNHQPDRNAPATLLSALSSISGVKRPVPGRNDTMIAAVRGQYPGLELVPALCL